MTRAPFHEFEVGDASWDDVVAGLPVQPYCDRTYLAAVASADGTRPVLLSAEGETWSATYVLVLQDLGDGRWMARTPEYGGPLLRADGPAGQPAGELRRRLDQYLTTRGVIGEVVLLDPGLQHRDQIAAAWSCVPEKEVCLTSLDDLEARWTALPKRKRSYITSAKRHTDIRCEPLTQEGAGRFAPIYAEAMDRLGASPRWRFDSSYFEALGSRATDRFVLVESRGSEGGGAALILRVGNRAAYYLAARWGRQPGAASLVLWHAFEHLAAHGVTEILLGGGPTSDPADSLLAFKRSFASQAAPLFLGGRVYDPPVTAAALRGNQIRPLPACAVEVTGGYSRRS